MTSFGRFFTIIIVGGMVLAGCATTRNTSMSSSAARPGIATGFINKTTEVNGRERAYVVYVPREYDPAREWPLILFLHGAGERGNDGIKQTEVGIGRAIRLHSERFPAIVVMPQCPENMWWNGAVATAEEAFMKTLGEYNIDRSRIYLTGISMGGYGTWLYGARKADVFAALMPICGGGRIEDAPELAKVPIWAFHGADDDVVAPEESRAMVEAVQEAGGDIRYTEFPKTGHNSWDPAYADEKHIEWLLRQRKEK